MANSAEAIFDRKDGEYDHREVQCVLCKGSRMLCGKSSCPILVKYYSVLKSKPLLDVLNMDGTSPPGVFVGRMGYPYVSIGPLIPPIHGDTEILDTPELWYGKGINEIVDFRSQLVRGKFRTNVLNVNSGGKIVDLTRELALSSNPTEVEAEFTKKPAGRLLLNDDVPPYGPSAPLKKLDVGNLKIDQRIERAYYDDDLNARGAVVSLYNNNILVSRIQKGFSVGAFGIGKHRRLVPTRWSITAVDSILSLELMKKIKLFNTVDEYRVYESVQLDNRWEVLMMPENWCYELVEAWYPSTVWNPNGNSIVIFSDHEKFEGRTTYAQIGGCYYAARLAVGELLLKERRQAGVVILREAHPGYIMPVGVWNVRENVRASLKNPPKKFDTMQKVLDYVSTKLDIPVKRWIHHSAILQDSIYQKRISDYATMQ
ncbi:MAG: Nre family DNA repair protein [Thermoplasmata archaeon]